MNKAKSDHLDLMLQAPVPELLWRLAGPNVVAITMLTAVTFTDAWYVGQLGTVALASLALVFPFQTLMQMMAGGSIGGGVTSSMARALGKGDEETATRVLWHAILIGAGMSLLFVVVLGAFPQPIFILLGGEGTALAGAVAYARIAFGAGVTIWMLYICAAALRGMGDTVTPSRAITVASLVQVGLSGALTLGWVGLPALGVIGPAVAMIVCQGSAAFYMAWHLATGRARIRLTPRPIEWLIFKDILKVGGIGLFNSFFMATTVVVVTGFIGRYGTEALAGYGLGARLELMLVPLSFGIGAALYSRRRRELWRPAICPGAARRVVRRGGDVHRHWCDWNDGRHLAGCLARHVYGRSGAFRFRRSLSLDCGALLCAIWRRTGALFRKPGDGTCPLACHGLRSPVLRRRRARRPRGLGRLGNYRRILGCGAGARNDRRWPSALPLHTWLAAREARFDQSLITFVRNVPRPLANNLPSGS